MPEAIDWAKLAMWSSIIGTPLTLIGLVAAIVTSSKSKSASEQAKTAVTKVREDILTFDTISDLSKAVSGLQEVKRLIRGSEVTAIIPDRLSDMRQLLITIRETVPDLSEDEQIVFQDAISDLNMLETRIDGYLHDNDEDIDTTSMLSTLSNKTDSLQTVLSGLRNRIGRNT